MSQSRGITASAVVLFIGSGFILMVAAFLNLRLLFHQQQFAFGEYLRVAIAIILCGVGLWGMASGVGVLRLRRWARVSGLIFSAVSLLFSVLGLFRVFVFPLPSGVPEIDTTVRATLATVCLAIGVLAGWSPHYFNAQFVRDQFQTGAAPPPLDASASLRGHR